jgi:hypothetical protein
MKLAIVTLVVAVAGLAGARLARSMARDASRGEAEAQPYAPSPGAAPFISLGYREAAADALFVRLRGYFGDDANSAHTIAALCEAIVELDPRFHRPYDYCGGAMTLARRGVDQGIYLRAARLLERGAAEFPSDWRLPNLAGQIYAQDLATEDPVQRRAWDEQATTLIESAVRKPGAPLNLAEWAAVMRTKFGQRERAIQGLREMLLITRDVKARRALIERLAALENQDADEIAAELYEMRTAFLQRWKSERPDLPPTWYILLGPRLAPGFDWGALVDRDLVDLTFERLPPLE